MFYVAVSLKMFYVAVSLAMFYVSVSLTIFYVSVSLTMFQCIYLSDFVPMSLSLLQWSNVSVSENVLCICLSYNTMRYVCLSDNALCLSL